MATLLPSKWGRQNSKDSTVLYTVKLPVFFSIHHVKIRRKRSFLKNFIYQKVNLNKIWCLQNILHKDYGFGLYIAPNIIVSEKY